MNVAAKKALDDAKLRLDAFHAVVEANTQRPGVMQEIAMIYAVQEMYMLRGEMEAVRHLLQALLDKR